MIISYVDLEGGAVKYLKNLFQYLAREIEKNNVAWIGSNRAEIRTTF
jgi:hypothetical protein